EEVQRRRVDPLQVVEEQYQGMFRLGECADKAPKGDLEQPAGLLWWKIGYGWLLADDQLDFGYELDHEPAVRPKRLAQRAAPAFQLQVALTHEAPHESLQRLSDRSVRNIALIRVNLAGGEKTP